MKKIPLTQGKFVVVDDCDYDWLIRHKWYARKENRTYYAGRKSGKVISQMHREILGLKAGDKRQIDHINHNGLDNRRSNLRICSFAENHRNRQLNRRKHTSKYKGVCWYKAGCKWRAEIRCDYKLFFLGYFDSEIDAAKAYDRAARKLFGEFACLNFSKGDK